jgi:FkbM family methyltransferase
MDNPPSTNRMSRQPATVRDGSAIGKSLDLYYRDRARTARMDRLNAAFVSRGSLVFDIGAHVGDRTGSFLRLGANVVAVEPQPRLFRVLRLIYGRHPGVSLRRCAVGAENGHADMYVNTANPTVSTLARGMVNAAPRDPAWCDQVWDRTIGVPVTTLDRLIASHGLPGFVKIDVEGHECDVLCGVSVALPALSFEITTLQRDVARRAVRRLTDLGRYRFNISLGEEHRLRLRSWVAADEICDLTEQLPPDANSGDVYAMLDENRRRR